MNEIKVLAVGDIYLQTRDNKHPFEKVKAIFKYKDILFGNLETVLSNHGKEIEKAVLLNCSPQKVKSLKDVDFDILNVANNHIMDLGPEGFIETLEVLNRNDLLFIGAGNHKFSHDQVIVERKGIKVGFLGYYEHGFRNSGEGIFINKLSEEEIITDIRRLKPRCDAIIISLHWGIEKVSYPSPKQIRLARVLIDNGANVILGHHTHVLQGIERYGKGLIAYSLGNFQFEFDPEECLNERTKRTNESIILSLEIGKKGLLGYDIIPIKIGTDFVPYIPTEKEQREISHYFAKISESLNGINFTESWWFGQIAEEYLSGNMKAWIVRIRKYGIKHFIQCIRWLVSPFVLRCFIGMLRHKKKYD